MIGPCTILSVSNATRLALSFLHLAAIFGDCFAIFLLIRSYRFWIINHPLKDRIYSIVPDRKSVPTNVFDRFFGFSDDIPSRLVQSPVVRQIDHIDSSTPISYYCSIFLQVSSPFTHNAIPACNLHTLG